VPLSDETTQKHASKAARWSSVALWAADVSAAAYVVQLIFDHVPVPALVGWIEFWGVFAAFAIAALITGITAVLVGWRSRDSAGLLGLVAIGYFVLMQTIQSLYDYRPQ
jgi:hypothetical protein